MGGVGVMSDGAFLFGLIEPVAQKALQPSW